MANTMKALQTITVGAGGASSIDFTSIPQTYTDLVIKVSGRSTYAGTTGTLYVALNGSVGTSKAVIGTGSAAFSANYSGIYGRDLSAANSTANTFGSADVYIPNYVGSNYKSLSLDTTSENNATAVYQSLAAGLWSNTAAVTSINLTTDGNFTQYSTATLYGVFNQDVIAAPAAPTIGTATAGLDSASVTFTGVSGAASYTMTSSPGSITATGASSPINVTGLTNGTAYTFTCKANNPIGSSAASAASNSVTPYGTFESIATVTVGAGGTTSVSFSSIPQIYTHLQIRAIHQEPSDTMALQLNGQTGNAYTVHSLLGDGGAVAAGYNASPSMIYFGTNYGSSGSNFGVSIVDILDYANTNKNTTVRALTGADNNSSYAKVGMYSGEYYYTNAVSSIQILSRTSSTIAQYSSFALYGIKAV